MKNGRPPMRRILSAFDACTHFYLSKCDHGGIRYVVTNPLNRHSGLVWPLLSKLDKLRTGAEIYIYISVSCVSVCLSLCVSVCLGLRM